MVQILFSSAIQVNFFVISEYYLFPNPHVVNTREGIRHQNLTPIPMIDNCLL